MVLTSNNSTFTGFSGGTLRCGTVRKNQLFVMIRYTSLPNRYRLFKVQSASPAKPGSPHPTYTAPSSSSNPAAKSHEETKGTTLRRSLSVGAVGVILSGAALAAANATVNEAPQTTVDNGAAVSEPILQSFALAGEGKVGVWGVPAYVVAPEKPVEETPVIEEAPIVEETPVEEVAVEAPVEEVVVEAPVEETFAAAPVEEAPLVAPASETEVTVQSEAVQIVEVAATEPVAPEPTLSAVGNQAKRDAVVAAAQAAASINAQTDCTMLATNSLSAVGINFHGWPMDYMSLGTVTSNPQPGDLVLYQSNGFGQQHIAVYIGNGQAVHGGWNGMGTSVFSVNLPTASAPIFVSPAGYNS